MTPTEIIEKVSEVTEVSVGDIIGTSRVRHIVDARKMAMSLMRDNSRMTHSRIGEVFGVTHSAVVHAIKGHKCLMDTIPQYQKNYEKMLSNI